MSFDLTELEARALALPVKQRAELASRLLASLDCADCGEDPEAVERAWIEEADRRYQEYLTGGVEVIPAAEAIAAVRAELSSVEANDIVSATLALSLAERDDLAVRLINSLDEEFELGDSAEVERLCLDEVERRHQRYLAGETQVISLEEAFDRVRTRVRRV